ncbi:phage head closure protein [Loigolactobacillus backii]|uniref:phage head closure protein n=1 Tax=Loigolactobacillus backii TaxID=375175 RepID=UPI0007F10433|nr:phage head closure protein [Loigolactobacillus backii]ANK60028.1 phage head-tail adapter protein [Loigolactobacillus backii]ANK66591.1 phage head-tail adapter protein [Loigolactobacillus backii]OLF70813.1 hypothetical protein ACX53_00370 [Loigolactobacillus backii]PIO87301.1 phage head-tail adapter protein [Loigolactobacillus backii]
MAKAINPSRMYLRLEFGSETDTEKTNPNTGESIKGFVPQFTRWAGQWSLSLEQSLSLAGLEAKDVAVFFIRHNELVEDGMLLRKDGKQIYQVDNINFDDGLPPDGFDLITCHKWGVNHG